MKNKHIKAKKERLVLDNDYESFVYILFHVLTVVFLIPVAVFMIFFIVKYCYLKDADTTSKGIIIDEIIGFGISALLCFSIGMVFAVLNAEVISCEVTYHVKDPKRKKDKQKEKIKNEKKRYKNDFNERKE